MTTRPSSRAGCAWPLAAALTLVPTGAASGEDPPPPPPAAEVEALLARVRALDASFHEAWRAGRYAEAAAAAREALAVLDGAGRAEHSDMAITLGNLASALRVLGRLDEALPMQERGLALIEKLRGPESPETLNAVNNLGILLHQLGRLDAASVLLERALTARERVRGPEHADTTQSLANLAELRVAQGRLDEALALHERALQVREQTGGPESLPVAISLGNLAALRQARAEHALARPLYERALAILRARRGPDHPDVGVVENNLAELLRVLADFPAAAAAYERALAILERALGTEHPLVALVLSNQGLLAQDQGRPADALPLYERSLAIRKRTLGESHPALAQNHVNIAISLHGVGRLSAALVHAERAVEIEERALGRDHPAAIRALNVLGSMHAALGQAGQARPFLERSLALAEKSLGPRHTDVGTALHNLADVLLALGDGEAARPLLERAVTVLSGALGPDHPKLAASHNNLGVLARSRGELVDALRHYGRALEILERSLGPDAPDVATSITNVAVVLADQGELARAADLYARALRIREASLGADHPNTATLMHNIAALRRRQGDLVGAVRHFERALAIHEATFGPQDPETALTLAHLALVEEERGDAARAWTWMQRCVAVVAEGVRSRLGSSVGPERLKLLGAARSHLDEALGLAGRQNRSGYPEVLRFKGLVTRANAAELALARRGGPEVAGRVAALRDAEERVAALAGTVPAAQPREGREERRRAWQERYAAAVADRDRLSRALATDFAPLRAGLERLDIGLAEVQAALGPRDALLDVLRSGDRYLAWVVRAAGEPRRFDLGPADEIDLLAAEFARAAASGASEEGWREAGRALAARILAPLGLDGEPPLERLVVCPDGALATVPFACLPGKAAGSLLADERRLVHVAMAQDLVPRTDAPARGRGALLVGGVAYGAPAEGAGRRRAEFDALPGTLEEARSLAGRLGDGAVLRLGAEATEAAVREAAAGKRLVHLATHGFVRDDAQAGFAASGTRGSGFDARLEIARVQGHDPLTLAGLALAGANARSGGGGDDGVLTALEASRLDLDGTELVVLSACQTALGKAHSGEGVLGLVQGFGMAGARQVLGSLWKVDDDATRELMLELHRRWSPATGGAAPDVAEALRAAQAHVRAQGRWSHPAYWAGWVLWGR